MKSSVIPITCGVAVAAMSAAGLSHWWSVRNLVAMTRDGTIRPHAAMAERDARSPMPQDSPSVPVAVAPRPDVRDPENHPSPAPESADQQRFYEALVTRMEQLQTQNRDLLDQLAETNRDLMKLEFRVDTHSTSFRPLPVTEDQPFTSLDTDIGVLPPRAEPIMLPDSE